MLADGTVFHGVAIGVDGTAVGEVVFNTAMTGYQEILSDPSYARQMVTLTAPHIGNTGATGLDVEADTVHASGLIVRDLPSVHSSFRATDSLEGFLSENAVLAIADIDTRALTRHLRDHGAQPGCLMAGPECEQPSAYEVAHEAAKAFPGLAGMDLAKEVTCAEPYAWSAGSWVLGDDAAPRAPAALPEDAPHVVAMDFGVKKNILRLLVDRGCRVTVVPATTDADAVRALQPDGLFLSNGPGDPEPCDYAISSIASLLKDGIPTFGICLGHQLLALASRAATVKMKFGHHGANHPVQDCATGRVMITSQNHGFAVDSDTLGNDIAITHVSLFDGSLQGIRRLDVPAFGFQGHPEASPGPHDVQDLFDQFAELIVAHRSAA